MRARLCSAVHRATPHRLGSRKRTEDGGGGRGIVVVHAAPSGHEKARWRLCVLGHTCLVLSLNLVSLYSVVLYLEVFSRLLGNDVHT